MPARVIGLLAGLGAGAMLSAISFDLVAQAQALPDREFGLWMLLGVGLFMAGDRFVEKRFGEEGTGGAMGIVVGSVVDGVPESVILGIQLATGFPVSIRLPGRRTRLQRAAGHRAVRGPGRGGLGRTRLGRLWLLVVLACGVAAALGFLAGDLSAA